MALFGSFPVFLPVLAGRQADGFLEDVAEMPGGGIAEIIANGRDRLVGITEEALCLLHFLFW